MFLWNVGKIFGHGLLSFALGVVRFAFSLGTVAGFVGMAVMGFKWLILRDTEALGEVALCLFIAFACFAVNVAIATVQRRLRLALNRSLAGTEADELHARAELAPAMAAPIARRAANDDRPQGGAGWR